jgi:hypothetical protein
MFTLGRLFTEQQRAYDTDLKFSVFCQELCRNLRAIPEKKRYSVQLDAKLCLRDLLYVSIVSQCFRAGHVRSDFPCDCSRMLSAVQ